MKKLLMGLLVGICLLVVTGVTYGNSGKAIIPFFTEQPENTNNIYTIFYISNITVATISVKVTFYNSDGTIIKDDNNVSAGIFRGTNLLNYFDYVSENASITFDLEAHSSGEISIYPSTVQTRGYGKIEWTQDDSSVEFGLIAYGQYYQNYQGKRSCIAIEINNGLPF